MTDGIANPNESGEGIQHAVSVLAPATNWPRPQDETHSPPDCLGSSMSHYETTIDVRTDDLGPSGHVNNSKFVAYTDLARDRYLASRGYGPGELEHLVVRLEIDYERELGSLAPITVAVDVTDVGETSFTLKFELRDGENRVVATVTTVAVVVDDGPTPIPEPLREELTAGLEATAE
ncbi:acyl-CoA thioesterase [Natronolimnohabitans innermongolicus]|uniref:Thioesterase n=1 Tax=Natronolimnohabitans innermongolicus JCM 12255 TaxID=1227499 RepID=L9WIQ7_9EURY|nr:acyl-CoA thioesterase [Natronolimnohabitans innermongolicus]ELY49334.1 thioesterase [Natronolimnohabitans innermongolicus JCM 12255]